MSPRLRILQTLLLLTPPVRSFLFFFFFNDTATTEIYTLSLHDALPIYERAIREDVKTQAAEMLEATGCRNVETYDDDGPPGFSVHEMGTARMGKDPRTSVLNAHNQAHDVPNLFVTDGACMASSSCVNPSLTYMALTAR